ncbi:MAG: hypothetical protein Ct9H300mP32_5920 [Verrucomicrobiota bacterium]|nr:MAG: hypothetical protein Ct9H300mP32_5920 [Verrucomicrobiota bacterium]
MLDWLASEFVANGRRLKGNAPANRDLEHLSQRRASKDGLALDAENRLLWGKSPVRLDAESLRDAVLAVSGKLNPKMGGPGFRDVSITPNKAPPTTADLSEGRRVQQAHGLPL